MSLEEFQVACLRSSRLYPLLGIPVIGIIVQEYMARSMLRRTLRLQKVEAVLKIKAEMVAKQKEAKDANAKA